MLNQFSRTELLLGKAALEKLKNSRVAVFGLGGVGGYVVEALARSGVGALTLADNDIVSLTNLNRQIIATHDTIGRAKTEAARERVLSINPECRVSTKNTFFLPETAAEFDFEDYDYVVDAIDTVSGKLALVERCKAANTSIICCMGTGNKLDPTRLEISDIFKTSVCPLARVMRAECRKRGIKSLKVLYSKEPPVTPDAEAALECAAEAGSKRAVPGSSAFVPPAAGLIIAAEVIKDLCQFGNSD